MRFTNRLWHVGAARWWVALAATLLGVAMVQALTPAIAAANPTTHAAADASPRYLNIHQCVYSVRTPIDSYTTVLRSGAGGTHVGNVAETGVNCRPASGSESFAPSLSGVVALDLNAGRYLNLHQCVYYSVTYHEWFTTVLPSGAGGTNVGNVAETGVNCPAPNVWQSNVWDGRLIPEQSAVVAFDLTAGRYLNLEQCVYRTTDNDLFTTFLPWSLSSGRVGGTNISNNPDTVLECRSPGEGVAFLPSMSGVLALDLQSPDLAGPVPNVVDMQPGTAINALQGAGFVAQTEPGSIDCGPSYVQRQRPADGTTAPFESTVHIDINRQPRPGQHCP